MSSPLEPKKIFFPEKATDFLKRTLPVKAPIIDGLLYHRDMVALGARRRHGKTTFVIDLAISLAEGKAEFLGYPIIKPAKTLLVLIEDDPSELQTRLSKHLGESKEISDNITIVTREDFMAHGVKVDITDKDFQHLLESWADQQRPDVIVLDNLSFLIGARFNDAEQMHAVSMFLYKLASKFDAALIVAAHPRKDSTDPKTGAKILTLENNTDLWFEQLMGSSHFINSMPSLWGMERDRARDVTIFVGGRQRVDGTQHVMNIGYDDGRLMLIDDYGVNFARIVNTPKREAAWKALPDYPVTFSRGDYERLTSTQLKSSDSRDKWLKELKRLKLVISTEDGRLQKASAGTTTKEWTDITASAFPSDWIDHLPEADKPEKYKTDAVLLPFEKKEIA